MVVPVKPWPRAISGHSERTEEKADGDLFYIETILASFRLTTPGTLRSALSLAHINRDHVANYWHHFADKA